jgi:iron complex transport system permease protein
LRQLPYVLPVAAVVAVIFLLFVAAFGVVARGLDFLALGEAEAFLRGISVERLKKLLICKQAEPTG